MKKQKTATNPTTRLTAKTAHLTKRDVVRVATAAVKKASNQAMKTAGYVIKAENGWVVRENKDGSIARIKKIKGASIHYKLVLD